MNKRKLYESIMRNVAKEVKKSLLEYEYWTEPYYDEAEEQRRLDDEKYIRNLRKKLNTPEVGDIIKIIELDDDNGNDTDIVSKLKGKTGVIKFIDDAGQLFGTWSGLGIIPEVDKFQIIKKHNITEGECAGCYNTPINTVGIGNPIPAGAPALTASDFASDANNGSGDRFDNGTFKMAKKKRSPISKKKRKR